MKLAVSALAEFTRRVPFEAIRWRLIPYALGQCQRSFEQPDDRTIRMRHGLRMRVDVSDWLGRHVYVTGEYEPPTTRVVMALLKPGDVFVDIGANAGYFTLLAASRVGPLGRVISFEPFPATRQRLEANIRLNGLTNCTTYSEAAFDRSARLKFYAGPANHLGTSSLRPLANPSQEIVVQAERGDVLIPSDVRVSMVKVDVEGAEAQALLGMQRILEEHRPDLVVEITPRYLAGMDASETELQTRLAELGYRAYVIHNEGIKEIEDLARTGLAQVNVLFTCREEIPAELQAN
ncbi:FkbM family methyltransferase [Candidatus Laterigemmans baculatus]|uniref:FkbM family methyltransferase n=1 Tax=Candidatus Laterigemmans baculatus TaxID=2770505 RepID=UPI0013D99734|nr:FkbM family methyltransferase [Candidatus Laterigemmans baculatus]